MEQRIKQSFPNTGHNKSLRRIGDQSSVYDRQEDTNGKKIYRTITLAVGVDKKSIAKYKFHFLMQCCSFLALTVYNVRNSRQMRHKGEFIFSGRRQLAFGIDRDRGLSFFLFSDC